MTWKMYCTIYNAVYSVKLKPCYIVYSIQYTMYCVQYAVCSTGVPDNFKKRIIWICGVDGHHFEEKRWTFHIVYPQTPSN